jgi:hypothetical protein
VPAERIIAETDAGQCGEEVPAVTLSMYRLDKDGHTLVVVEEPVPLAVEQSIGIKATGVDVADGIE